MSDVYQEWIRITHAISRTIHANGGTSSHVAAIEITMPADTFDEIMRGSEALGLMRHKTSPLMPKHAGTLNGVRIVRGPTQADIQEQARRRNEPQSRVRP